MALMSPDKAGLELEKVSLEIDELRLKVAELKRPDYKRATFWFSVGAAAVAVFGVLAQGYLSAIKSERAELRVERAREEHQLAEARRDTAVAAARKATERLAEARDSLQQIFRQIPALRDLAVRSPDREKIERLLDRLGRTISETQGALFDVSATSVGPTGGSQYRLSLSSDPSGATVYLIPADVWRARSLTASADTNQLASYRLAGSTPTITLVVPGLYVVLFDLHGIRRTLNVDVK